MKVLVVVGSLRGGSFSRKLAEAAVRLAPEGMSLEIIDGRSLPLFDQDLEAEAKKPAPVQTLLDQITGANAVLFVTPEFNAGIPGPLKNLIDWASRPPFQSPLRDKPALILAHSPAPTGGVRAHSQLAAVLAGTLTPVFLMPSFLVPAVHEKFDAAGGLVDEKTSTRMSRSLQDFGAWVKELDRARSA